MSSRLLRSVSWPCIALLAAALGGGSAQADPLYAITDLGTLPGQTSSVATAINNQGQVVGISYNSSDGYFGPQTDPTTASPPRFQQSGSGAQSFLYSNGQMTQINPTGGLAMSINNSGQVVGGPYSSINDAGQYVGGSWSGIQNNYSVNNQLVSGGTTTALQFMPYAINNSGQIVGLVEVNGSGGHPALYQNGQITDLLPSVMPGAGQGPYDGRAIAVNQKGDILINILPEVGTTNSYLYSPNTGTVVNLTALSGSGGFLAAALNNKDQAVGNGFLYSSGSLQTLASLLPVSSGWSELNATGINGLGQIVGQGVYNGQLQAFEMTPIAENVPEPGAIAVWSLGTIAAGFCVAAKRME